MVLTAIAAGGVLVQNGISILGTRMGAAGHRIRVRVAGPAHSPPADADDKNPRQTRDSGGLRRPVTRFVIAAAVILVAAPNLASSGAELARQWGIASGFFGGVPGGGNPLPEVAVVGAAIRAGAHTLAVSNVLGSNCFSMVVLLVLDIADGAESLPVGTGRGIAVGAVFAIVLSVDVRRWLVLHVPGNPLIQRDWMTAKWRRGAGITRYFGAGPGKEYGCLRQRDGSAIWRRVRAGPWFTDRTVRHV